MPASQPTAPAPAPAPASGPATDAVAASFERPATPLGPPAPPALLQQHLAAARRFVAEALGQGDAQAFDELVADDVWVSSGLKPDAPIRGKAEYGQVLGATLGVALSGGSMVIHEVLPITDGRVLVRFTAEADHTGTLDGIAPLNRRITLSETHLYRFRDGRIVENYVGALNPLQWEMLYAPVIAPRVLPR